VFQFRHNASAAIGLASGYVMLRMLGIELFWMAFRGSREAERPEIGVTAKIFRASPAPRPVRFHQLLAKPGSRFF